MDAIDTALITAFNNLTPQIRDSRLQALQRCARTKTSILTRPFRDNCLVLRASDLRINQVAYPCTPDYGPWQHLPHNFQLAGADIADLNKPIFIPPPGIPQYEAAERFGRNVSTLTPWVRSNVFDSYTVNAWSIGKRGKPIHVLSTPTPLNPNNQRGQPPHPIFGTNWQYLYQKIPPNFVQTFHRTPLFWKNKKHPQFQSWLFTCPGLLPSNPNRIPCFRSVTKLYSPTTFFNIFKALDIQLDLQLPSNKLWSPGQNDPLLNQRAFACQHCWDLQFIAHANPKQAWNQLVTQITAGLLFGHEVPIPKNTQLPQKKYTTRPHRKHKPTPLNIAAAQRRIKIEQLLINPKYHRFTAKQIAKHLNTTPQIIYNEIKPICNKYGVRTRKELSTLFPPKPH